MIDQCYIAGEIMSKYPDMPPSTIADIVDSVVEFVQPTETNYFDIAADITRNHAKVVQSESI